MTVEQEHTHPLLTNPSVSRQDRIALAIGWQVIRRASGAGIRVTNLDTRLAQFDQYPELKQLTDRLNEMIARLEAGFTELSRFSEDLAHEMRTPLNTLIGQSQQCLSRPRNIEDYEALLLSNLEEHERLSRMINSMLFLARAEQAESGIKLEQVSIKPTVARLFDYFADIAEERGISLVNETNGEHIETAHLPRLFDRFYRCDPARQDSHETGGLGLAIVASIMKCHGGRAEVSNLRDGVNVSLIFPG